MSAEFIPDIGQIVWLSLDPQRGREQAGRRPFLVLSPQAYNDKTSLIVGCPVTSQKKGYPFEVVLSGAPGVSGVILVDQVKSLDWRARLADFAAECGSAELGATRRLLAEFLQLS